MPYSEKFREKMVAKLTGPEAWSANALSKEVGVSQNTLSRWLREATLPSMVKGKSRERHRRRRSAEDRLRLVREAARLGDGELGEFLRREGLHDAELERYREEVLTASQEGSRSQTITRPHAGAAADQAARA